MTEPFCRPKSTLAASTAATPPKVDGTLDDACWRQAGRVDDFVPLLQVPGTDVKTTVLPDPAKAGARPEEEPK